MVNREDVIFYDTFENFAQPPSIQLSNDIFYGGFALEHPISYDPFIDETIYYPKAYFKRGIRYGNKWSFEIKDIELERCKREKFGKAFQDKLIHNAIDDLYCFKEMNETLVGHFSYDFYSFFYVQFFPCVNSSENNNHCKPMETIDYYLTNTFICFEMQDIELTPQNYTFPVRGRNRDIYFTVGKKLFQEVHIFYQLINIKTNLDIFGFNKFKHMKEQQFLKFESQIQMTNLIDNNIYETGEAFCAVTIKLFDEVRIQKRSYTSLIEIISSVGGFMHVILILLRIFCYFLTNILYEISLINNLFEFDLGEKLVLINHKNNIFENNKSNNKNQLEFQNRFNFSKNNYDYDNKITLIKYDKSINNNLAINKSLSLVQANPKYIKNGINKSSFIDINNNQNSLFPNDKKNKYESDKYFSIDNFKKIDKDKKEELMVHNIYFNQLYICLFFCCIRKRKNIRNILLNEGMKIFMEKLDITNLFKKMVITDDFQKIQIIKMSDYCKNNLRMIKENFT